MGLTGTCSSDSTESKQTWAMDAISARVQQVVHEEERTSSCVLVDQPTVQVVDHIRVALKGDHPFNISARGWCSFVMVP